MKKHQLRHNVHHDAFANQCLPEPKQGVSQGTNHCEPGSAFTRTFPQLHVDPDKRLFPEFGYTIGGRREK